MTSSDLLLISDFFDHPFTHLHVLSFVTHIHRFMYLQVPSLEKYQIVAVLMIRMIFNRTQCLRQSDLTVYVTVAYLIYI